MRKRFLQCAVISECKWENLRPHVDKGDFKDSKFFKNLSAEEVQKFEKCVKYQDDLDNVSAKTRVSVKEIESPMSHMEQGPAFKQSKTRRNGAKDTR